MIVKRVHVTDLCKTIELFATDVSTKINANTDRDWHTNSGTNNHFLNSKPHLIFDYGLIGDSDNIICSIADKSRTIEFKQIISIHKTLNKQTTSLSQPKTGVIF